MNSQDKMDLQVAEEVDGSAVAFLTPDEVPGGTQGASGDDGEGHSTGGSVDDDHDDPRDNIPDADPAREALRLARRDERQLKKKLQKAKASESNHLINSLKRQNEQMAERLAVLEKRTAGSDLARLDKAIEDGHLRLQYAKMKVKEATEMADGAASVEAQETWYEARRQVEALEALRKKAVNNDTPKHSVPKAADPLLKRHASDWMARNDWYDPNGEDMDSTVATKIDEKLMSEGWDPKTAEYWEELDNRLTKYLPHRYNGGNGETNSRSSERRPRSVVTSSGREHTSNARPGEFRLSPERVKAIKEAGRWDNLTERNKMIRKYAEYDRMQTK
jgi:hypothetical protein